MHVLALVTDAFGGYGGIAQYNRDLLAAMVETERIETIDVLPRLAAEPAVPGMAGLAQHRPRHNRITYSLAAIRLARLRRPDFIFNGHLYHAPLAMALQRMTGAAVISQLHGTEVWDPFSPLVRMGLAASRLVLCVSRDTQARYLAQSRAGTDNSAVLHNTVGEDFRPGERQAARARFALGDEFVLLTVGRLDPRRCGYKGHELVMRAMAQDSEVNGRTITYLVAGEGEDGPRLQALANQLGVGDRVRFLGLVPREALPDLYRAADLFALPSTGEGFGIVFLEAMASGTPAIGLDRGGIPDALAGGDLGTLASPGEFAYALSQTIRRTAGWSDGDRRDLSEKTVERFGLNIFRANVKSLVNRYMGS